MKHLLAFLCLLLSACAQAHPPTVAIRAATIVDVTEGSLRADHTVLIAGNRIAAVGPADEVRIPDGADVIDAACCYLIPGLWDMHVHSVAKIAWDTRVRSVANVDWHFPLFLAHGVTGVRNMNDGTADVTLELTTSVKRRLAEGDLRGPRLLANGPTINGDPPVLATNPVVVRTAAEARAVVDKLADGGADFIKVYETLSRDAYFAIMDQAQRRGIPVDGHVPFRVRPEEAADAGQRTVEHVLAMALGCSSDPEAEREEFERVLSGFSRLSDDEQFLTLFRHERRLYDGRDPAACAATIEAYRRNGMAEAPFGHGQHAACPAGSSRELEGQGRLRAGADIPSDPPAARSPAIG
jgi:imidazolonepropionase-like amidohydrolase